MYLNKRVKYWLELAEYDISSAKVMLNGGKYLYVGFMCHQTIEKALKAVISSMGQENMPSYTHNLIKLAREANLNFVLSKEQRDLIDTLNPLSIETRYPAYKEKLIEELNKEKCIEILKSTEELFSWIKEKL
jgi:HEPN domain-containing protein